jgi:hypothetical protein
MVGSLFLVGIGVLSAVRPTWAQSIGADVWNVPALQEQVRASVAEETRLDCEDGEVMRRIAVKEAIAADLAEGRCTLAEATDRFNELNATRPEYVSTLLRSVPGATDREKFARNVISYALIRVEPSERPALSSRLEAELRQMLADSAAH